MRHAKTIILSAAATMLAAMTACGGKNVAGESNINPQPDTVAAAQATAPADTLPADTVSTLPDGSIVIHTAALCPKVEGYAGAVPLDITVTDGRITDIKSLANNESPEYFGQAAEIFRHYIGMDISRPDGLTAADAVTGATYSSNAIIENIAAAIAWYRERR